MNAEQVHKRLNEEADWYSDITDPRCVTVGYELHGTYYATDVLLSSNTPLPEYHLTLN